LSDFKISVFNTRVTWNATHKPSEAGTEALRQVVLFPPKKGGITSCLNVPWRSQQPRSSTKLTSL